MRVHSIREGKVFNWIDRGEARLVEGGRPLGVADLNHDAFDIENKIEFENGLETQICKKLWPSLGFELGWSKPW